MVRIMKGNIKEVSEMALESIYSQIKIFTKVNGSPAFSKDSGNIFGKMVIFTKEIFKAEIELGKEK